MSYPACTVGNAAGTGATVTFVGTVLCGSVILTTGTGTGSGTLFTISLGTSLVSPNIGSYLVLAADSTTEGIMTNVSVNTAPQLQPSVGSGVISDNTTYKFVYKVI